MIRILSFLVIVFSFNSCSESNYSSQSNESSVKSANSSIPVKDQVWFYNTQYGIAIETPKRLEEMRLTQPSGSTKA